MLLEIWNLHLLQWIVIPPWVGMHLSDLPLFVVTPGFLYSSAPSQGSQTVQRPGRLRYQDLPKHKPWSYGANLYECHELILWFFIKVQKKLFHWNFINCSWLHDSTVKGAPPSAPSVARLTIGSEADFIWSVLLKCGIRSKIEKLPLAPGSTLKGILSWAKGLILHCSLQCFLQNAFRNLVGLYVQL